MSKYLRPTALRDVRTHYCAGCGHGIIHRMIAELLDELGVRENAIGIAPVGCAILAHEYLRIDMTEAPHGRAPAVATGIKRIHPDKLVICYQGDGDLAAIGTGETIHTAARGENISVIFVNNAVYGMTGGQMAPTTMVKQLTQTTPKGRDSAVHGYPIRVCELLSALDGPVYIERTCLSNPANVRKARRAILKSFKCQLDGRGYSLVEILSPCPTYWRLPPNQALKFIDEQMTKVYPLGVFRDFEKKG